MAYEISRFIKAHQSDYQRALSEIKNGKKVSHWMWYIFPQIKGLGRSSISEYYGIQDLNEAKAYYNLEGGRIEEDEVYEDFYSFLKDLYDLLGIGE